MLTYGLIISTEIDLSCMHLSCSESSAVRANSSVSNQEQPHLRMD